MTVVHEKYLTSSNRQGKRNKKKTTAEETTGSNIYTPSDKERVNIVTALVNRLKTELNTIDAALGKRLIIWFYYFIHHFPHYIRELIHSSGKKLLHSQRTDFCLSYTWILFNSSV